MFETVLKGEGHLTNVPLSEYPLFAEPQWAAPHATLRKHRHDATDKLNIVAPFE